MIASLRQRLAPFFPLRPEQRSAIDGEIALELAHHLESLKSDLIAQGHSPEGAAAEAARRFGPVEAHAGACRDIALKEHRMWQKIQIALIIVLTLALATSLLVSYNFARAQSAMTEALRAQAEVYRAQAEASGQRAQEAAAAAAAKSAQGDAADRQSEGVIYITGLVARPGPYAFSETAKMTLWRAIISAGGLSAKGEFRVTLTRGDAKTGDSPATFTLSDTRPLAEDPIVRPGDVISVMRD